MNQKKRGYGRIFCNYPLRRADVDINQGMSKYHFSDVRHTPADISLDPRAARRTDGNAVEYKESRINPVQGFSTPYSNESKVQDRVKPLHRDIVTKRQRLSMGPSTDKKKPLKRNFDGMPLVTVPNPAIPVYDHIIAYQYVEQMGTCPCTPHRF